MKLENVTVDMLGSAKKITITKDETTVIDGNGDKAEIEARVKEERERSIDFNHGGDAQRWIRSLARSGHTVESWTRETLWRARIDALVDRLVLKERQVSEAELRLLADERRQIEQLAGRPGCAAGNEYRTTATDPDRLAAIALHGGDRAPRRMDVRITRAGPWGGETAEMTLDTLINHALAGTASLWLVAHGSGPDGSIEVTLDGCELSRWGWAPDALAARDRGEDTVIVDVERLADRLAGMLDARDARLMPKLCFRHADTASAIAAHRDVSEALRVHPALAGLLADARDPEGCA